jgi:hypothetical protein
MSNGLYNSVLDVPNIVEPAAHVEILYHKISAHVRKHQSKATPD